MPCEYMMNFPLTSKLFTLINFCCNAYRFKYTNIALGEWKNVIVKQTNKQTNKQKTQCIYWLAY